MKYYHFGILRYFLPHAQPQTKEIRHNGRVDAKLVLTYTRYVSMVMDIKLSQAPQTPPTTLSQRVQGVLDSLRPMIQWDGGDVELLAVNDAGVVTVRFHGACVGCPSSQATLRLGLEKNIRERIPEITAVISEDELDSPPTTPRLEHKNPDS